MMKTPMMRTLVILSLLVSVYAVSAFSSERRDYVQKTFSTSLENLRHKAQGVAQRNQWLWAQIQMYQKNIPVLEQQIRVHEEQHAVKFDHANKHAQRLQLQDNLPSMDVVSKERQTTKQLAQQITSISKEIKQYQKQLAEATGAIPTPAFQNESQARLFKDITDVRKKIHESEAYLKQLQKRHGRRSAVYRSLLEKQSLLQQKYTLLENEELLADREQGLLVEELKNLEHTQKEEFAKMNQKCCGFTI